MRNRILALLLVLLIGLLFYGCRRGEGMQPAPSEPAPVRWVRFEPPEYIV